MTFGKLMVFQTAVLACLLLLLGCTGDNGSPDVGENDAKDGSGDENLGDEDLGDDFGLYIPPGTEACALDPGGMMESWNPSNLAAIMEKKGRVALQAGLFRLFRDQETFEVDLIDKLQLGADGAEAAEEGPGTVTRTVSTRDETDTYRYMYEQNFQADGEIFLLSIRPEFEVKNGVAVEQTRILDDEALANQRFYMTGQLGSTYQSYSTCSYIHFDCSIQEFEFEDGKILKVERCALCPQGMICKAFPAGLKRAEFRSGQQAQTIDDYFQLAHAMRHHNWGGDMLVVLNQPMDSVSGLYLGSAPYPAGNIEEVHYLDSDLTVIDTKAVVRQEQKASW